MTSLFVTSHNSFFVAYKGINSSNLIFFSYTRSALPRQSFCTTSGVGKTRKNFHFKSFISWGSPFYCMGITWSSNWHISFNIWDINKRFSVFNFSCYRLLTTLKQCWIFIMLNLENGVTSPIMTSHRSTFALYSLAKFDNGMSSSFQVMLN